MAKKINSALCDVCGLRPWEDTRQAPDGVHTNDCALCFPCLAEALALEKADRKKNPKKPWGGKAA